MSNYTIKCGKGELSLRKSSSFIGLKGKQPGALEQSGLLDKERLPCLGGFHVVSLDEKGTALDKKLDEVRGLEAVETGTHVYYAEGDDKPMVPTGDLIIVFQPGLNSAGQKKVLKTCSLELVAQRGPDQVIARVTVDSPNPVKAAALLKENPGVRFAEPDMDMLLDEYAFSLPTDSYLAEEWHLLNPGVVAGGKYTTRKGADARVVDAWRRLDNLGSAEVVVAVIDNGIDISHPDLKSKIYRPFDLWTQSDRITDGDPAFTHGTPCASLAVAVANGQGMVGVAPNARLMPVCGTSFSLRATEQMFDYCIQNGADIISCSWGTTDSRYSLNALKEDAIARAARNGRQGKGCVILFAAGNEGLDFVNFYAALPDVICVGASDSKDRHASYSNQGQEVTVCAPSNGDWPLLAARAWWDPGTEERGQGAWRYWADGAERPGPYKHFGGTSGATPIVAGICALMLSANPELTAREVREILIETADKIGAPAEYTNGHSRKYGYGRVNADKAVAAALRRKEAAAPPPGLSAAITSGQGLFRFEVEKLEPRGFGVQTGVFADYGNVLIQAEKLQRQFEATVVVSIQELNGKTVYKLLAGAFADRKSAERLQKQLKAGGISGFIKDLKELA